MNPTMIEPGALRTVSLQDRYGAQSGAVLLNGNQALVRALVERSLDASPKRAITPVCVAAATRPD